MPITCTWQPTFQQAGDGGILTVYTGSTAGAAFSAMRDEERVATAVHQGYMEGAVESGQRTAQMIMRAESA